MINANSPKITYLYDYQPPNFSIEEVTLKFDLYETNTYVTSTLKIKRNHLIADANKSSPLVLDGQDMELKAIHLNGRPLEKDQYEVTPTQLTIPHVPDAFILETLVIIKPQENFRLTGLYKTGRTFCTQCESHGFRCITYYLDRPDILARFTVTISADKTNYPILLCNGNLTAEGTLTENRHWVTWQDPTLKPCYLFALVAGDLDVLEDTFLTKSNRSVRLFAYVEKGKSAQVSYALTCLKEAMRWDEEKYGREYDLERYMIVGVSDFNFGAMENKGLNIFNDKYILAAPEMATDEDFLGIKNVIAHEYFHNWSGNRVTVRDWFQITLKEGLTVFRDQQFTADTTFPTVKRIQEAKTIRNIQFVQDTGPMAHPIYPDSYIEINNFYTVTVYEKGAEVIRMMQTLLGEKEFRKAMDLYFSRHDGHPATTLDFVKAMEYSSGMDLTQFQRWYKQAGTPVLTLKGDYNSQTQIYTLTVQQSCPATPNQPKKELFHIPLVMGLLDRDGKELILQFEGEKSGVTTKLLSIKNETEVFNFVNIPSDPVPSLLRGFSAPVKINYPFTQQDYLLLLSHDTDLFNRWNAQQQLMTHVLLSCVSNVQQGKNLIVPTELLSVLKRIFQEQRLEKALITELLILPSEAYLLEQLPVADVDGVYQAREWLKRQIALALQAEFAAFYEENAAVKPYQLDPESIATRKLKNTALSYLALLDQPSIYQTCLMQFNQANNMTDMVGALMALNNIDCPEREEMLEQFYQRWQSNHLVMHKWFACQAQSTLPNTLETVKSLTQHPDFDIKNPNRVRALISTFCTNNLVQFHCETGKGYIFLADYVLKLDKLNPQLAARMIEPLTHWKKYNATRQQLMKAQLQHIATMKSLSNDLYEIVAKSLR